MSSEVWVTHPVFGEGRIEAEKWGGTHLKVKFKDGLVLWVSAKRVRFIRERRREKMDILSARRMIEAFRLGIVPSSDVEKFTYGREKEKKEIEKYLDKLREGKGGALLFEGEYGSGKTHLLELINYTALRKGFAVAFCSMDPEEIPPYRPKRVYREIVRSFTYIEEGEEKGFREFLMKAEKMGLLTDHKFFGPFLRKLKRAEEREKEILWQWVEGESTKEYALDPDSPYRIRGGQRIPALYDYSTAADFYCYILSGMSNALREMGKGGLVLILDEGETVTHTDLRKYVERGWSFLSGLVITSQNRDEARDLERGLHNKLRPVPYIYRRAFMLVILAMTPLYGDENYEKLREIVNFKAELTPLSSDTLMNLTFDLIHIYLSGYPDFQLTASDERKLVNRLMARRFKGLREYVKASIAMLDEIRWKRKK